MKSSLVSYRTTPYKALALPHENEAVVFDDVEKYQTGGPGKFSTRVEMSRDNVFLYLKVFCFDPEPQKVINTNTADDRSLWTGDLLEIFFGAIAPQPWQLQLCVGAGGDLTKQGWNAILALERKECQQSNGESANSGRRMDNGFKRTKKENTRRRGG